MYLIRRARLEDAATLLKLAKMVHFINLPADHAIINEKILWSRTCFADAADPNRGKRQAGAKSARAAAPKAGKAEGLRFITTQSRLFMFVLEDLSNQSVLGTSQIIANMGGPGNPNCSFQLTRRDMFSTSLQSGATHTVARLHLDETGPTEIGGLILQPSFRKHIERLGRFLSLVRFHFVALNRPLFADRMIAELMPPLGPDGDSTFYEAVGRRFINLSYPEADRFCQSSKEFLLSLMPREDIYLSLLPPEARTEVGQVGPETAPARKMLESLGFAWFNRIDPFDGGPHIEAVTDTISIVRSTARAPIGDTISPESCRHSGFVSTSDESGEFRAVQAPYSVDKKGRLRLTQETMDALQAEGQTWGAHTPMPASGDAAATPRGKGRRRP